MVNNIGKTTQNLSANLGEAVTFSSNETITVFTGEIGKGFLVFDPVGTLGVVSEYESETNFTVTTFAISIDIQTILTEKY